MFPGLTAGEVNLIRQDWRAILTSAEASAVTITYSTKLIPGDSQPDPVYHVDRSVHGEPVQVPAIPCLIQIVHQQNLKILSFGIVGVGDAILYFLDTLNLEEPQKNKKPIPETLHFTDNLGNEWMPILKDAGPLKRFLAMELSNMAIAQVVPCTLRKG